MEAIAVKKTVTEEVIMAQNIYHPPPPPPPAIQQTVVVAIETPPQPDDHFSLALFSCLCCFWPLGLVAIIFSKQVRPLYEQKNYDMAMAKSILVRKVSFVSIGLGIIIIIIAIATTTVHAN